MDSTASKLENLKFECQFCNKSFRKERSLLAHVCESKRRFLQRNDRAVRVGLSAYQRFYETTQNFAKTKTFEEFESSDFYLAFVRFGRYVVSSNVIRPQEFVDWLIKNTVKLDKWCQESYYQMFLTEWLKIEASDEALERSINNMDMWSKETGNGLEDFFLKIQTNKCVNMLTNGRISPWLLYNCDSGMELLSKLTDEQLDLVADIISPVFWKKKFKDYPADAELVRTILHEAGIK